MALEPGGVKDQLVTAAADGEMKMVDFRMLGDAAAAGIGLSGAAGSGSLGVWKTVNASATSRNLSALAAHPNAPLLATGTATQAWLPVSSCSAMAHASSLPLAVCHKCIMSSLQSSAELSQHRRAEGRVEWGKASTNVKRYRHPGPSLSRTNARVSTQRRMIDLSAITGMSL